MIHRTNSTLFASAVMFVLLIYPFVSAGPINTDVALTPHKGGSLLRLQYVYSESDGNRAIAHTNSSTVKATFVHGVTEKFALFFTAPFLNRQTDKISLRLGRFEEAHDGVGDLTVLAKYRFWQEDTGPGETRRFAAIGGLNIRSGDSDFSSDSYDPVLGAVFTARRDRSRFDADLVYQINTGRKRFRHDTLRYDLSYAHRIFPTVYDIKIPTELDIVVELNGTYSTNGSHELFLSPGLQYATTRWILESSLQIPVMQDLVGDALETDYRLIVGIRYQW